MTAQRQVFREIEADAWLERNRTVLEHYDPARDPVVRLLRPHLKPGAVIAEVGCALAHRVAGLAKLHGGRGLGVDPSARAVEEARRHHPTLTLDQATAESLPWPNESVDALIYGFCLYVCDRGDLFSIAAEGDRVLREFGVLVVFDFLPPFAYRNPYSHRAGLHSFKMNHANLWSWNPAYIRVAEEVFDHAPARGPEGSQFAPDERVGVTVLRKLPAHAYPERPAYGTG
jgi:ubiquinone/menaquinone biosynthesis C-methylase UbiE